jgi:hypothetical protein
MGCSSSSSMVANPAETSTKRKKNKKSSKDDDTQDLTDSDVHKMREDLLQRHDSEVDIIAQIAAEREALKIISSRKIERRCSCEDLLDILSADEIRALNDAPNHFQLQRAARAKLLKRDLQLQSKRWLVSAFSVVVYLIKIYT